MATYTWKLAGSTETTIGATDVLQFAGASFGSAVQVGSYNDSTHVQSSGGSNSSSGNSPRNNKYLTSTTVSIDGGASTALSGISNANCALHLQFSHTSAVAITNHIFYAYDGSTTTAAPTGVTFRAAEKGDSSWSTPHGSGSALSLDDHSSASNHDFYIAASASPSSVGAKTAFVLRDELTYS